MAPNDRMQLAEYKITYLALYYIHRSLTLTLAEFFFANVFFLQEANNKKKGIKRKTRGSERDLQGPRLKNTETQRETLEEL